MRSRDGLLLGVFMKNDKYSVKLAILGYTLVFLCIIIGVFIVLGIAAALIFFFSILDATIITIIFSAILAIMTFAFTKRYEYKLFSAKDARENKTNIFQEYVTFLLLNQRLKTDFDQKKLQEYHTKLIFKVSNSTVNHIYELIQAIQSKNQGKIDACIKKIINCLRKELGYNDKMLNTLAINNILFDNNDNNSENI